MDIKAIAQALGMAIFRYPALWRKLHHEPASNDGSMLRNYAVPIIALVQLLKFPLIGEPRPAMFLGIVSMLVDSAVLYVLAGGVLALLPIPRTEEAKGQVMTVFCYALTPCWLAELAYGHGVWSILIALFALLHALASSREGLVRLLSLEVQSASGALTRSAFFMVLISSISFFILSAATLLVSF
uniref:Yip1 domain-containing protein n=1 Tax=Chlorobium chlorochromatii (strain CaD3) TaxID=340177 RepID=Q3AR34_CHLCH